MPSIGLLACRVHRCGVTRSSHIHAGSRSTPVTPEQLQCTDADCVRGSDNASCVRHPDAFLFACWQLRAEGRAL